MKILIIDDDIELCEVLVDAIEELGFDVDYWTSFTQEQLLKSVKNYQIMLLDLQMPTIDGIETLNLLGQISNTPSLILISGQDRAVLSSSSQLVNDNQLTLLGVLQKPFEIQALAKLIEQYQLIQKPSKTPLNAPSNQQNNVYQPTEQAFCQALSNNELVLYYQPKISLESGKLVGAEALVRWQHPIHGMLSPALFLHFAEQQQHVEAFTQFVITTAINQQKQWYQAYQTIVPLSVNVSANYLTNSEIPQILENLTTQANIPPSALTIELTESVALNSKKESLEILTRLRLKGFHLSIDDFGTGYASLQQLKDLPFNELKIDTQFTFNALTDPDAKAILESSVALAEKLNKKTVIEGIETKEAQDYVRSLNAQVGQGYFYSKPVDANQISRQYLAATKEH